MLELCLLYNIFLLYFFLIIEGTGGCILCLKWLILILTKILETFLSGHRNSSLDPQQTVGNMEISSSLIWVSVNSKNIKRQPWSFYFWLAFCRKFPPNICLHCMPSVTNTLGSGWSWQHKKTLVSSPLKKNQDFISGHDFYSGAIILHDKRLRLWPRHTIPFGFNHKNHHLWKSYMD